jgi:hypothetical protein
LKPESPSRTDINLKVGARRANRRQAQVIPRVRDVGHYFLTHKFFDWQVLLAQACPARTVLPHDFQIFFIVNGRQRIRANSHPLIANIREIFLCEFSLTPFCFRWPVRRRFHVSVAIDTTGF